MAWESVPPKMKAQQFSAVKGGLEKNLRMNESASLPSRKPDQHLIQTIAAALNPVDYKPAELPLVTRFFLSKPVCPSLDVVGRIVQPADGSPLKPGQLVFGFSGTNPLSGGALAEYAIAAQKSVAVLPEGVNPIWGAAAPVAGLTAYQSIVPFVNNGNNVFINGGSGGTGVFGIQIAKAKGCYVATTCSTPNVDLCKSLGADEVIDYKKQNVLETLKKSGRKYDHIVDNVGSPGELFYQAHQYTNPKAAFVSVGASLTFKGIADVSTMMLLPGFLGGGKRKHQMFGVSPKTEDLAQLAEWMKDGQVKPVIDSTFKLEDAAKAFEKLKTGRAKGKIIVEVAPDA